MSYPSHPVAFAQSVADAVSVHQGVLLASSAEAGAVCAQHAVHAALGIESYHDANACLGHQAADSAFAVGSSGVVSLSGISTFELTALV